jgi:hypothetical protein
MVEQMFELGDLDKNAFTKAPLVNAWAKQAKLLRPCFGFLALLQVL